MAGADQAHERAQYRTIKARTPSRTRAIKLARRKAMSWLRVYTRAVEDCHSDGGNAGPEPIEDDAIRSSPLAPYIPPAVRSVTNISCDADHNPIMLLP